MGICIRLERMPAGEEAVGGLGARQVEGDTLTVYVA
jgi:hypothetical protein